MAGSDRHNFQFLTHRVNLCHFVRREGTHDGAAIGDSLNNPLFLEFEERKSDVGAMRVELLAKILLDQPLARVAATKDDVLF